MDLFSNLGPGKTWEIRSHTFACDKFGSDAFEEFGSYLS